jgi:L,D-peptidoglycan transpeptidase YkuD (ErfK/YbiS/YcfS/YnhG family)
VALSATLAVVAAVAGCGTQGPPAAQPTSASDGSSAPSAVVPHSSAQVTAPRTPSVPAAADTVRPSQTKTIRTATGHRLPIGYGTADARQVITVVAPLGGTDAQLQRWTAVPGGWQPVGSAVHAYVGGQGVGPAREGYDGTPAGSFTLTQAFGRYPRPVTALPYFQTDPSDWWAGDSSSPSTYNTHQRCAPGASCGFNKSESEQLYYVAGLYNYAVVIACNRHPAVPGKGSAFFLHVQGGSPTGGCVAVDQSVLLTIMAWLKPALHPRIVIGTG